MYAIRSYYEQLEKLSSIEERIIIFADSELDFLSKIAVSYLRITSYNVCYTKLLRLCGIILINMPPKNTLSIYKILSLSRKLNRFKLISFSNQQILFKKCLIFLNNWQNNWIFLDSINRYISIQVYLNTMPSMNKTLNLLH